MSCVKKSPFNSSISQCFYFHIKPEVCSVPLRLLTVIHNAVYFTRMMNVSVGKSPTSSKKHKTNSNRRSFPLKYKLVQSYITLKMTFVFLEVGERSPLASIPPLPRFAKCSQPHAEPHWPILAITSSFAVVRLNNATKMTDLPPQTNNS